MDTAFVKELYFWEFERRHRLDAAPTFRIGILALLAGVYSFYFDIYEFGVDLGGVFFLSVVSLALVFSLLAVAWIVRSYIGYTYDLLPHAEELAAYHRSLKEYEQVHDLNPGTADQLFDEFLQERLVAAATRNGYNNNSRSELIYGASRFLSVVVFLAVLGGIPVALDSSSLLTGRARNGVAATSVARNGDPHEQETQVYAAAESSHEACGQGAPASERTGEPACARWEAASEAEEPSANRGRLRPLTAAVRDDKVSGKNESRRVRSGDGT